MLRLRKHIVFYRIMAIILIVGDLPFFCGLDKIVREIRAQEASDPENFAFELQANEDINELARKHGYSAYRLFEWVRKNVKYEPYFGTVKGAGATLTSGGGNDLDQALLLGALLNISNVPWKLIVGPVQLPIERAQNWLGVSSPDQVADVLQKAGIDFVLDDYNNPAKVILKKHHWIEAQTDYFPMRGMAADDILTAGASQHLNPDPLNHWSALDPSITFYSANDAPNILELIKSDGKTFQSIVNSSDKLDDSPYHNLPIFQIESAALAARQAVSSYLKTSDNDIYDLLRTSPTLELPYRSGIPANLPYEILDSNSGQDLNDPVYYEPDRVIEYLTQTENVRREVNVSIVQDNGYELPGYNFNFSSARGSAVPLTIRFDDATGALAGVSDGSFLPFTDPNGAPYELEPVVTLNDSVLSGNSTLADSLPVGERLWLEIKDSGSLTARIPIVVGGRYQLIVTDPIGHNALLDTKAQFSAFYSSLDVQEAHIPEGMQHAVLDNYLTFSGRMMLHQASRLCEMALSSNGYMSAGRPDMLVVGLEPDISNDAVGNVSLVAHHVASADEDKPVSRSSEIITSVDGAKTVRGLARELGISNALNLLSESKSHSIGSLLDTAANSSDFFVGTIQSGYEGAFAPNGVGRMPTLNGPAYLTSFEIMAENQLRNGSLAVPSPEIFPTMGWGWWDVESAAGFAASPYGEGRTAWAPLKTPSNEPQIYIYPYDLIATGAPGRYQALLLTAMAATSQIEANIKGLVKGLSGPAALVAQWLNTTTDEFDPIAIPAAAVALYQTEEILKRPRIESLTVSKSILDTNNSQLIATVNTSIPVDSLNWWLTKPNGSRIGLDVTVSEDETELIHTSNNIAGLGTIGWVDGMYRLSATCELGSGVRSEEVSVSFTVDNTVPHVEIQDVSDPVSGTIAIKGRVVDDNLLRWTLSDSSSGEVLGTGTSSIPLLNPLANVDTFAEKWNNNIIVRLHAVDLAGHESSYTEDFDCRNDIYEPEITITPNDSEETLSSPAYFQVVFEEQDPPSPNLGLKQVSVKLQSQSDLLADPISLYEASFDVEGVSHDSKSVVLDSNKINQTVAGEKWKLVAEALDFAGNKSHREITSLKFDDILWKFDVVPPSFPLPVEDNQESYCTAVIDFNEPCDWKLDVVSSDGTLITSLGSGIGQSVRETWNGEKGSTGGYVSPGVYQMKLTYLVGSPGEDSVMRPVTVLPNGKVDYNPWIKEITAYESKNEVDETEWGSRISFQSPDEITSGSNFIATDEWPIIHIKGQLPDNLKPYLGSDEENGVSFPPGIPSLPMWILEFKSSSASPTREESLMDPNSYETIMDHSNWHHIASGTTYPSNGFVYGVIDTKVLPVGYYDVRLWVTDGSNTAGRTVYNLKATHGDESTGTSGGEGADDIGALTLSAVDMTVPFEGGPVTVSRSYNSNDVYDPGPLGYGWTLNGIGLEIEHYANQGGGEYDEAYIQLPDGREFFFASDPTANQSDINGIWAKYGEYVNRPFGMRLLRPGGSRLFHSNDIMESQFAGDDDDVTNDAPLKLSPGSDGSIPLTRSGYGFGDVAYLQTEDKTWYIFEWETGDLIEIIKPDGQIVTYHLHDEANIEVEDSFGRNIRIVRDTQTHRIKKIIDPAGKSVTYEYDDDGNLSVVTDRSGRKRFYFYDTPKTKSLFPERSTLTGSHPHYLVDVRVDDDLSEEHKNSLFEGDTVPPDSELSSATLIAAQEWPGDVSVLKSEPNPDGTMKGIETYGGSVGTEHLRNEDGSGMEVVTGPGGVSATVTYDAQKRLTAQTDFWGNTTNYSYDDVPAAPGDRKIVGVLESETNALGEVMEYDYTAPPPKAHDSFADMFEDYVAGQIGDDTNQPGYLTGAQAQPTEVKLDAGTGGVNAVTKISYDMSAKSASAFQPTSFDAPGGSAGTIDYNNAGKLTTVAISGKNGVVGATTANDYFEAGEVGDDAWKIGRLQSTTVQATPAAPERLTSYDYKENPHGGVTRIVTDGATGLVTSSVYDGAGNLVSSTNARGETVTTETDGEGRIIRAKDEQGNSIHTLYNVLGQKYQERLVHVFETGVEPVVITTRYKYDPAGRIIETVREGQKSAPGSPLVVLSKTRTRYKKTAAGRVETSYDSQGLATRSRYDNGGRLIKTEQLDAQGGVMSWTAYEYDALGRKIKEIDNKGIATETDYDGLGRVEKTTITGLGGINQVTANTYDDAGRTESVSHQTEQGQTRYTVYDYDELGRLVYTYYSRTAPQVPDAPDADDIYTHVEYNEQGQRWRVTDEEGSVTEYTYDEETGAVKTITLAADDPVFASEFKFTTNNFGKQTAIENPLDARRKKVYDSKGRLKYEFSPVCYQSTSSLYLKRQATKYEYYASGKLKAKHEGIAPQDAQTILISRSTRYFYDPMTGQLLREEFSSSSEKITANNIYTYTAAGDLKRVERWTTSPGGGELVLTHWRNFTYDPRTGQEATISSPEGFISYTYHQDGSLASINTAAGYNVNYTYDPLGNIKTVSGKSVDDKKISYSYNGKTGRKVEITRDNGVSTSFTHDERGWLSSKTVNGDNGIILKLNYIRDNRGLIETKIETREDEQPTVWTYTYDKLKRLKTASGTGQNSASYSYTYDKAGNRLSKSVNGNLTSYGYNFLDQLVWESSASGEKSYIYDDYGNLTTEKLNDTTKRTYTWNAENRLIKVQLHGPNDKTYTFRYGTNGTRVQKEVADSGETARTNYLSDYLNPSGYSQTLQETNKTGTGNAYIWSGDGILAQTGISSSGESSGGGGPPPQKTSYVHTDHLGSIKAMTDGTFSSIVTGSEFNYTPFGELTSGETDLSSFQFTGQYAEDELELQFHRARWLSVGAANWLSHDLVWDFPGNFGNGYAYVGNNPIYRYDASGKFGTLADIGSTIGALSQLATIGLTAFEVGTLWGEYAGGGRSLISTGLWTIFALFGGAAITKMIGLVTAKILGTVIVHGRPLLSKLPVIGKKYKALLAAGGGRRMGDLARDFVAEFYKGIPFVREVGTEIFHKTAAGRRFVDVSAKFIVGGRTKVEVKHWSAEFLEDVLSGRFKIKRKMLIRQLEKDAALAAQRGISRIDWHFTKGIPPHLRRDLVEFVQPFFENKKIHIYDWSR